MKRRQAFKFLVLPNGEQTRKMRQFAGAGRFVYNKALALQKEQQTQEKPLLSYNALTRLLTQWRHDPETAFLKDAPAQILQQRLKDLMRAYTNFFEGRAEYPVFKKKYRHDSFRYPDPKQIKLDEGNCRIFLPKLGWMRYRKSRDIVGKIRNVTVSGKNGKWYVSIQTEVEVEDPVHPSSSAVGIDLGVARFATLSDGTYYAPLNSFRRHEQALAKAQRRLKHKRKFSNNWKKAKARIARIHERIARVRADFLHKTSTAISKNHAIVCIEDLQVKNMTASASGTKEQPGRNVAAKSGLNKSILDQGWYEFRRQLDYKLAWRGGQLIVVAPHYTSQTCPHCGHVSAENRKTQAKFLCLRCGFEAHADVVGAMNILARGMQSGEGRDTPGWPVDRAVRPEAGTHRSAQASA